MCWTIKFLIVNNVAWGLLWCFPLWSLGMKSPFLSLFCNVWMRLCVIWEVFFKVVLLITFLLIKYLNEHNFLAVLSLIAALLLTDSLNRTQLIKKGRLFIICETVVFVQRYLLITYLQLGIVHFLTCISASLILKK